MDTKILLVDDETRILQTFARTLRLGGYTAITAASGHVGVALYHQQQPDIVLLDLRMPGMSGLEALQAIREHDPEANVILCTAHGDKDAVIDALRAGASDFLPKPIDQVTLESALRRAEERIHLKRQLRASQEALRRHNERLEEEVKARTADLRAEIEERKRTEEALRESEARYRRLLHTLQEGVWAIDAGNRTTYVNPRMTEMLGYSEEEMLGKGLFDFMDEQGVVLAERLLERRRQGLEEQHEFQFLRKDGQRIYTLLESAPILDQTGQYCGAIAGVIDITERKQAEKALRESEHKLRNIIEGSPSGIVLCDEEGIIIEWNPAQEQISGIPAEEALGETMWQMAFQMAPQEHRTPQACEWTEATMREMLSTGRVTWPQQAQKQVVERPDGTRCVVETEVFSIETNRGFMLCSMT